MQSIKVSFLVLKDELLSAVVYGWVAREYEWQT